MSFLALDILVISRDSMRLQDGGDDVSEGTVGGPVHVLIKDLHIEDFTALGALEPRSSSPPPRPEMSNVSWNAHAFESFKKSLGALLAEQD